MFPVLLTPPLLVKPTLTHSAVTPASAFEMVSDSKYAVTSNRYSYGPSALSLEHSNRLHSDSPQHYSGSLQSAFNTGMNLGSGHSLPTLLAWNAHLMKMSGALYNKLQCIFSLISQPTAYHHPHYDKTLKKLQEGF